MKGWLVTYKQSMEKRNFFLYLKEESKHNGYNDSEQSGKPVWETGKFQKCIYGVVVAMSA